MPMRNSMRSSAAAPVFCSGIACCTAAAQRTASTTLANSSPVVLVPGLDPGCGPGARRSSDRGARGAAPSGFRACPPHPPPSAANTPPHRRRGSRQGGGSGSCVLARRQTQTRQVQLVLIRIPPVRGARHHYVCQISYLLDRFSCLVKAPHLYITGGEKPVRRYPIRLFLQRLKQCHSGFFESPGEEVGHTDPHERVCSPLARVEAQGVLQILDRGIGLPGPQPEPAAPLPTNSTARIELQGAVE